MEKKIEKIMEKFKGKNVKATMSGIIESKFYIKNLKYRIKEKILQIENDDGIYLDIDIDDIYNIYVKCNDKEFLQLILNFDTDLQIKLSINGDNIIILKNYFIDFSKINPKPLTNQTKI